MDVLLLFSIEGSLVLASNVIFAKLRFMFISLITKGLVHFGLVCNIHQPELHRGMTFEPKAFLFSNDEAGEKYGDPSQQHNKHSFTRMVIFDAVVQDFLVFLTEHLVVEFLGDDVWQHFFAILMDISSLTLPKVVLVDEFQFLVHLD